MITAYGGYGASSGQSFDQFSLETEMTRLKGARTKAEADTAYGEVIKVARRMYGGVPAAFAGVKMAADTAYKQTIEAIIRSGGNMGVGKTEQILSSGTDLSKKSAVLGPVLVGKSPAVAFTLESAFPAPIENSETLEPLVAGPGGMLIEGNAEDLVEASDALQPVLSPEVTTFAQKVGGKPPWMLALGALVILGGGYWLLKR